jgi:hypothetical protein
MKLPETERAFIDPVKVRDYLLNPFHTVGSSQAFFFTTLGFAHRRWPALYRALLDLASRGEAEAGKGSEHGQKYTVRGTITGPNGREAYIVSVWIVRNEEDFPRLVTAFPGTPNEEANP